MPKDAIHERYKQRDAGEKGKTEVVLPSGNRLDALTIDGIGTQIERSQDHNRIKHAAKVLKEALESGVAKKAQLRVRNEQLAIGEEIMREIGLGGKLTNLTVSKEIGVRKQKKS
jgi:hypothetical protein